MNSQQLLPQTETEQEEELRRERRVARMFRRNQRRKARIYLWSVVGGSALLLGLMGFIFLQIQSIISINTAYPITNGVSCDHGEQLAYHIHVHLTIYINGKLYPLPQGVGIAADGSCIYWMHTHKNDGIIHIEAPAKVHNVALDDFLTIWHQGFAKLNFPPQLTQNTGWKIFVNGKPFAGVVTSPLSTEVTLSSHDIITMEYGKPNPPPDTIYVFPPNLPK
jgi:hypothetical protein